MSDSAPASASPAGVEDLTPAATTGLMVVSELDGDEPLARSAAG